MIIGLRDLLLHACNRSCGNFRERAIEYNYVHFVTAYYNICYQSLLMILLQQQRAEITHKFILTVFAHLPSSRGLLNH